MMIDTHCHLSDEDYDNLDEVIKRMGNNIIIVSGCDDKTNQEVLNLCSGYKNVYGTLGIHPEQVNNATIESLNYIEKNLKNPKIVGIGEIGLDYYWNKDNKDLQITWFKKQLSLAKKYNKSVVIHSREAIQDTYDILKQSNLSKMTIHCYSSSLEMAQEFIKIGARLGIGGILTFKNSEKLKNVVKNVDLNYLLLETDSPYLSPEPKRGHKNEPINISYVAEKIAEIKEVSIDEVFKKTTQNAIEQFDLMDVL